MSLEDNDNNTSLFSSQASVPLTGIGALYGMNSATVRTVKKVKIPDMADMSLRFLLRSIVYTIGSAIVSSCIISSGLTPAEKFAVVLCTSAFTVMFEAAAKILVLTPEDEMEVDMGENASYLNGSSRGRAKTPILQALSALDVYSPEAVGPDLLPSAMYPSDHLAIASDFVLIF